MTMKKSLPTLPLHNSLSLLPFINYYKNSGYNTNELFNEFKLTHYHIHSKSYIPTYLIYKIITDIANRMQVNNIGIKATVSDDYSHIHPNLTQCLNESESFFDFFFYVTTNQYLLGSHRNIWVEHKKDCFYICHQTSAFKDTLASSQGEYHRTIILLNVLRRFLGENWKPDSLYLSSSMTPPHSMVAMTNNGTIFTEHELGRIPIKMNIDSIAEKFTVGKITPTINTDSLDRLKVAINTFIEHEDLSLTFISEVFGSSKRNIQRILKDHGTSFQRVIQEQKNEHAIKLLSKDYSIIDIAQKLGYNDPSNFTRAFKTYTGISPSLFRQQKR